MSINFSSLRSTASLILPLTLTLMSWTAIDIGFVHALVPPTIPKSASLPSLRQFKPKYGRNSVFGSTNSGLVALKMNVDTDADTSMEMKPNGKNSSESKSTSSPTAALASPTIATATATTTPLSTQVNATATATSIPISKIIHKTYKYFQRTIIRDGIRHPKIGKRGEWIIALEIVAVYSLLVGRIPLFDDLIKFIAGPVCMAVGVGLVGFSWREFYMIYRTRKTLQEQAMSKSKSKSKSQLLQNANIMSAYIIPNDRQNSTSTTSSSSLSPLSSTTTKPKLPPLITTGIYSYIRHPFYFGLFCIFSGASVAVRSVQRLLVSVLYLCLVQYKCRAEEKELLVRYPTYSKYDYDYANSGSTTIGGVGGGMQKEEESHEYSYANYQKAVEGRFLPSRKKIMSFLNGLNGKRGSSASSSKSAASASANGSGTKNENENIKANENENETQRNGVLPVVPANKLKPNKLKVGSAMNTNSTTTIDESTSTTSRGFGSRFGRRPGGGGSGDLSP